MNLNTASIIGRVGKDPEARSLPSGGQVVSFSVATSRSWAKDGEKKEETEWHNVVAFGKLADIIAQYVVKGMLIYIQGRIQTRSWDDKESGQKRYKTEIVAENMQMGPKAAGSAGRKVSEEVDPLAGSDEPF